MSDARRTSSHHGGGGQAPQRSSNAAAETRSNQQNLEDVVDNSRVYFSVTEAPSCADDTVPSAPNTPAERKLSRAASIGSTGNYITKNDPLASLNAHITSAETRQDTMKKYTVFRIAVKLDSEEWIIFRRYSQFHSTYMELVESHGKIAMLPKLPPKRISPFGNLSPDFVEKRRRALNQWLRNTINDLALRRSPEVLWFLDVPRHRSDSNE